MVLILFVTPLICGGQTEQLSNKKTTQDSKRPNILFVLADDQSSLLIGAFIDKVVQTLGLDRVPKEAVLFTNSFAASPSCIPSRSAVISGQDIWRIEEDGVLFKSIPQNLKIYPHMLESSGYHVGYTGKGWLPGIFSNLRFEKDPIELPYNSKMEEHIAQGIDRRDYTSNFQTFLKNREDGQPFCFWFGSTEPHRVYEDGVGEMMGKN